MRAIVSGKSMILFSIIVTCGIAGINILIKDGISRKSFSELLSIFITSGITSGVVFWICKNTNPKIYQDEMMRFNGIKSSANAIVGIFMLVTLGIYMDIISRIIFRLDDQKDRTDDTPLKELFEQGMELGKKYIVEKVNMIVLVLASVLLFFVCASMNRGMGFSEIINQPEIFAYSLMAIVCGIGVILCVPVTACMYAFLNRKKTIYKTVSENKVDGKRSLKL